MDLQFTGLLLLALLVLGLSWFLLPGPWAGTLLWLARKAAGLQSRDIEVDGIRWHFLAGGYGPALVMLHGFGADSDHWLRVAFVLKKRFRVLAPDLPGFGLSDPGAGLDFDVASQAGRLRGFLDALGVDRCILAGNSMGGWIATACAAANPGRVRALWLLAPLGVRDSARSPILKAVDENRDSPMQIANRAQFEDRVLRPMFARMPWIPYPLRIFYGNDAVRRSATAGQRFQQLREASAPLEELAAGIDIPVLLQWGNMDRAVDVSGTATLQGAFANIEAIVQPRTGHLPMLETPGDSIRLFLEFFRRNFEERGKPAVS